MLGWRRTRGRLSVDDNNTYYICTVVAGSDWGRWGGGSRGPRDIFSSTQEGTSSVSWTNRSSGPSRCVCGAAFISSFVLHSHPLSAGCYRSGSCPKILWVGELFLDGNVSLAFISCKNVKHSTRVWMNCWRKYENSINTENYPKLFLSADYYKPLEVPQIAW